MRPSLPGFNDLPDRLFERNGDVPSGIVPPHLAQVGVIADVVTTAVLVVVPEFLRHAREGFRDLESFENRARVRLAAANVIDLAPARVRDERINEARHIK